MVAYHVNPLLSTQGQAAVVGTRIATSTVEVRACGHTDTARRTSLQSFIAEKKCKNVQKDSDDSGGPFIHRPGSQRWAPANSQESQNEAQAGISLGREDTLSSSLRDLSKASRSDPQSKNRS